MIQPLVSLFAIAAGALVLTPSQPRTIGEIEFFGYKGVDLARLRTQLPLREGEKFDELNADEKIKQTKLAIERTIGRAPTEVSLGCCDLGGNWTIFIGLSGAQLNFRAAPNGGLRLPQSVLSLYDRFMEATAAAVKKGSAIEDRSKGYALSSDPELRAVQLEMRTYALAHEALVRDVLADALDDQQRIAAAEVLGYAQRSRTQIVTLLEASRDPNGLVRNNAVRALLVLAYADPEIGKDLPPGSFVDLLLSGNWTDLNKASILLSYLTRTRNSERLAQLSKPRVLERLLEMARWRTGHAEPARYILGRLAGISEPRLRELVESNEVEAIIQSLPQP